MTNRSLRVAAWLLPAAFACAAALAQQSGSSTPAPRGISGDGRGLATFGDRGLTTFGDRPLTDFSHRPLEHFGDTPLATMGGLRVTGDAGPSRSSSTPISQPSRFILPPTRAGVPPPTPSIASLHGVVLSTATIAALPPTMPRVELPVLTLDHRPALAALDRQLRAELKRVEQRGDVDLARSLEAALAR
jgi:hypothetical protein